MLGLLENFGKPLIGSINTEEFGAKKYAVGQYWNFKMADDKPITPQVHDLQTLGRDSS